MESTTLYTLLLAISLIFYLLSGFITLLVRQALSPLALLRGPPCPSFFMGNLMEMHDQENNNLVAEWEAAYGSTFVYRGFIGGCRLMTTDPVAVAHILGNAYDYPKPDFVRDSLATMAAGHDGLLTVEGDVHKRQRKILTPAFSSSHIKSLTPIFWDAAQKLRDIWLHTASLADGKETNESKSRSSVPSGYARVDVLMWLGRATLDAIGLAGFGYHFNSLTDDNNELAQAFGVIFSTARKFRVMTILQVWFPFLRRFRRNNAVMTQAHGTMRRIGLDLIEERSRAVIEEQRAVLSGKGGEIDGDKTILGRDILSVLIRSNIATAANANMSVDEVLCQISTFIAAGHETTSSALTWCLYALVQNPLVQRKLRAALRDVERDLQLEHAGLEESNPQLYQQTLTDQLSKCEYLDWVIREALRLHAPITSTMRVCMRDEDEIPVSSEGANGEHGGGGCVDKNGKRLFGIRVKKWDIITIPIQAINKSQALWGEDARAFKPERWAQPPSTAKAIPGLYSNTLTFLNGNPLDGNRACIGYKFALIEMKIFLYTLVKDIEFRQEASMVIEKKVNVVTRPFVKSEPELGNQMPLYIRRASPSDESSLPPPYPSSPTSPIA
ncbi:cytochrome P450 [Mycena albidolilacea]|uniref:Cytochrome P450 n=1 Tax=Mycena albidolilacea TaxID=1033008 RepID=A0AAD7F367_9AGAR|nr:cytochrome P450 [Mycena albidolilacea]